MNCQTFGWVMMMLAMRSNTSQLWWSSTCLKTCKSPIWSLNMKASNMGESIGEYTCGTGIDQSKMTLSISMQGSSSSAVTKEFSYMLMKSGSVVLKAQTDMKGYTPEQIIKVMANISNQSGKSTGHMAASLVQVRTPQRRIPASAFLLSESFHLKINSCWFLESDLWDKEAHSWYQDNSRGGRWCSEAWEGGGVERADHCSSSSSVMSRWLRAHQDWLLCQSKSSSVPLFALCDNVKCWHLLFLTIMSFFIILNYQGQYQSRETELQFEKVFWFFLNKFLRQPFESAFIYSFMLLIILTVCL